MATIDLAGGSGLQTTPRRGVYFIEKELDFAAAVTANGTALAADDIIEILDVPAYTVILNAGFEVTAEHTGTSTDCTLDLGVTGIDVDVFVDGFDFDAAAVGAVAQNAAAFQPVVIGATADTIDVEIQTQTGTTTGGKIRVWALLCDIDAIPQAADEVTRDQLA